MKSIILPPRSSIFHLTHRHIITHQYRRKQPSHHKPIQCTQQQQTTSLALDVPTLIVQDSVRFTSLRTQKGTAIVVSSVTDEAYELGIRPGLQLLKVSDPIRYNDSWELNDRSSLRYIQDAVRMRRAEFIYIELSSEPHPLWNNTDEEIRIDNTNSMNATIENNGNEDDVDLLTAIASSASEDEGDADNIITMTTTDSPTTITTTTIGEKLMQKAQVKDQQLSALEKRIQRRKEYMNQASERNDGPFFAFVFALFLLPSVIILGIAVSTGYLDSLSAGWR